MGRLTSKYTEFFDSNGRRIPKSLWSKVCDANRDFRLEQPKLDEEADFAKRILRLHECLNIDTGITAKQFKAETGRLLAIIRKNPRIANITKGVYLPVILPKTINDDIGAELELYLAGVNGSYIRTFGDRKFFNKREGTLAGRVIVVQENQHNQLRSRMKEGPVIGLYFPNPLQGFSIHASREQVSTLSRGFILSGIDTIIAMIMYPDVLARDEKTPALDMASLLWWNGKYSLCFWALEDRLEFDFTEGVVSARSGHSSGLLFLG